jgi:cytochrome c551/c552
MGEVVTSRAACCCRYGASDNFGPAYSDTYLAAAYSPQKIHEIRFLVARA